MYDYLRKIKRYPYISFVLVGLNFIVFLLINLTKLDLVTWGSLSAKSIMIDKEYYRIISSIFLHINTDHLFSNMILLLFMGSLLEKEIGHFKYIFIYFCSGIGANMFSLVNKIMNTDLSVSIGASGAIFGLDGLLLALVLFSHRKLKDITPVRVVFMILLSLYSGFRGINIDNAAHIGGDRKSVV